MRLANNSKIVFHLAIISKVNKFKFINNKPNIVFFNLESLVRFKVIYYLIF
jgi:hypothetical protein